MRLSKRQSVRFPKGISLKYCIKILKQLKRPESGAQARGIWLYSGSDNPSAGSYGTCICQYPQVRH